MTYAIGRTEPNWADLSEHVAHLVKGSGHEPYENIIGILAAAKINCSGPFGAARNLGAELKTVSFTETPPHLFDRLFQRRVGADAKNWHGIGFKKTFVVARGGGPVHYAYEGTPHRLAIEHLIERAAVDPSDEFRKLAPMIELAGGNNYFEWEREWRVVGSFGFDVADVSFLVMPEHYHSSARGFFEDAQRDDTGPAYFCPYIDATWERDRIVRALQA